MRVSTALARSVTRVDPIFLLAAAPGPTPGLRVTHFRQTVPDGVHFLYAFILEPPVNVALI